MSPEIKTFIITSLSLTLGWVLNELSSFFKAKKEQKNSLREVLHVQLNIWFIIRRTNITYIRKGIKQSLISKGVSDEKSLESFDFIFKSYVESLMHEIFSNGIQEIESKYKQKIENLAVHYPFLAYKLSDKQLLHNYLNTLEKYLRKIELGLGDTISFSEGGNLEEAATNAQALDKLRDKIKPYLYNEASMSIENDIIIVSKKLGMVNYFSAKKFLKKKSEKEFLKEYIEQIDQLIIEFEKNTE